jgi:IS4 transposase
VAKVSEAQDLPIVATRLAFLNETLSTFHKVMTESTEPNTFYFLFEELLILSNNVILVAYEKEERGIGNILDDVAFIVFQTLSKHKVLFRFR